jgi:Na+-transporting NADH:ubiquinone oxidoreductase subunit NqrB
MQTPASHTWLTSGKAWLQDARHFQIVYLSIFLLYGIFALQWAGQDYGDWPNYGLVIGACLLTQLIGIRLMGGDYRSLKSALITGLGLSLLTQAGSPWSFALAGVIAIASKFLIRYRGKHIFNPANFGLVGAILLTGALHGLLEGSFQEDVWVNNGKWGSSVSGFFVLGALGFLVLAKVKRIDTSLAFLLTFGGLVVFRDLVYLGDPDWRVPLHTLTNGSLLLFTFFMITDPKTTPNARPARILWAILIGIGAFVLVQQFRIFAAAPIYVLFVFAPITALFDYFFKGKQFSWDG